MRTLIFIMTVFASNLFSQNNIRLVNTQGKIFKVILNEKVQNKNAQAEVLIENIKTDTLSFKVEFENGQRYGATVYLLDKSKACTNKEFNYKIELANTKLHVSFTGVYDAFILPKPIVPKAPAISSTSKPITTNTISSHSTQKNNGTNCVAASDEKKILEFSESLKNKADDGLRIESLKKEYSNYCYSKNQVITVLKSFMHDREKLEAAELMHAYCLEKENYNTISEVFSFPSSINELNIFLKSKNK